jgi:hypothetical protein
MRRVRTLIWVINFNLNIFTFSKKILNKSDEIFKEILKNNFLGNENFIKEFMVKFNDYLLTLTIDQICVLSNLLLGNLILIFWFNIIFIYYGDVLIKYFALETKYPKLAKIISLRRKVLNVSMFFYFSAMFILIITLMLLNISYLWLKS